MNAPYTYCGTCSYYGNGQCSNAVCKPVFKNNVAFRSYEAELKSKDEQIAQLERALQIACDNAGACPYPERQQNPDGFLCRLDGSKCSNCLREYARQQAEEELK